MKGRALISLALAILLLSACGDDSYSRSEAGNNGGNNGNNGGNNGNNGANNGNNGANNGNNGANNGNNGGNNRNNGVEACTPGACPRGEVCALDGTCQIPDCAFVFGDGGDQLLGVLLPLSGGLEFVGESMLLGAELAVLEFDDVVGGLQVIVCDTGTEVDPAQDAHRYLVEEFGVTAFVGPALSGQLVEMRRPAVTRNTVLLSPSSTSPAITNLADDDLIWRLAPTEALAIQATVDRALTHPARQPDGTVLAILDQQDPFVAELGELANVRLEGREGVRVVRIPQGDFRPALQPTLEEADADAVIVYVGGARTTEVLEWVEANLDAPDRKWVLFAGLFDVQQLTAFAVAQRLLDDIELVGVSGQPFGPAGPWFHQALGESFGQDPGVFGAHTYDAVWALAYAGISPPAQGRRGEDYVAGLRYVLSPDGVGVLVGGPTAPGHPPEEPWRLRGASSELVMNLDTGDCLSGVVRWGLTPQGPERRDEYDGRDEAW